MRRILKALRRFLKSVPARASGSFMPSSSDNVVRLRYDAPTGRKNSTIVEKPTNGGKP